MKIIYVDLSKVSMCLICDESGFNPERDFGVYCFKFHDYCYKIKKQICSKK